MKIRKTSKVISTKVKNPVLVKEKHLQISRAAGELFSKKGYHCTSMRDIAAASGINLSYLYQYIETKDDILYLFYKLLQEQWAEVSKSLIMNPEEDPVFQLKLWLKTSLELVRKIGHGLRTIYSESRHLSKESLKVVLAQENEFTLEIESLIKRGIQKNKFRVPDSYLAANIIQYLLLMYALRAWNFRDRYNFNQFVESTMDFILKGLGVSEEH